jgi:hypothetical protein
VTTAVRHAHAATSPLSRTVGPPSLHAVPEVLRARPVTICKIVGSAYVGSNPARETRHASAACERTTDDLGTVDVGYEVPSGNRASGAGTLADRIALVRMNSDSVIPRDRAVLASTSRSCGRRRTATSAVR